MVTSLRVAEDAVYFAASSDSPSGQGLQLHSAPKEQNAEASTSAAREPDAPRTHPFANGLGVPADGSTGITSRRKSRLVSFDRSQFLVRFGMAHSLLVLVLW